MSIQSEITLLQNTKSDLRTAIMEKGVTVYPSDLFSTYPTRISAITTTAGDKDLIFKSLIDRSVTSINIPSGTTKLRTSLFENCTSLASVTFPNTLTKIGKYAFANCSSLASITIPSSVTTIGRNAFRNSGLTSIDIPDTVTSIGHDAFYDCTSLATVNIGDGITVIEHNMFRECTGMTTLSIGNSVTTIDTYAFYGCRNLTEVTIPASVTRINDSAFEGCFGLHSITCLSNTPATLDGGPFDLTNNCPIYVPAASVQAYKTAWPNYASRIQGIVDNTLFNSIVDRSISGDFTIPSDVTTIGLEAFRECHSLTSLTIPSTVTEIMDAAFLYCTGLNSITCLSTTPPTLGTYSTFDDTNNCPIYVPAASVNTYKTTTGWQNYASRIQAIPNN